jgi:hypothetical protein
VRLQDFFMAAGVSFFFTGTVYFILHMTAGLS